MILFNEFMRVEIAEAGAELMRIRDCKAQTELLWNGDPRYWKRRSPILFPNVGRTFENVVRIGGKIYPTAQHGFARDMVFACEASSETQACFLLTSSAQTRASYPFDFDLRIRYTLEGRRLRVDWLVDNRSDSVMPFTIGGHPAFCFSQPTDPKEDYLLRFPGKRELTHIQIDVATGAALPGSEQPLPLPGGELPLTDALFAQDALVFDGGQFDEVWLCSRDGRPRVGMNCAGFSNFGVWSVAGAPFVCLEPWAGRCDDRGFCAELSEKPNVNLLKPGQRFEKSYSILLPEA